MGEAQRHVVAPDPAVLDSIQGAIESLGAGGLVYLGPGSYRVSSTILLPSDVALVGAGPDRTTLTLDPGSDCHVFSNTDHAKGNERIELRGFRLEGNMRDQQRPPDVKGVTFACGGYFKRVENLSIDDIVAQGIRQTAFHFNHCTHVDIHRMEADELGWSGVSTSGTDDIVLRRVVVTNSGLDVRHSGIHLDGGRGAYVDAVVDGCTGNGIMLDSKFSPLCDVVVRGVGRRSMRGLSLSGDHENPLTNVSVSGDYSDNAECGILVSNASNVFIVDATIASNAKAGIVIQGKAGSSHCVVANTRITASPDLVVARDGNKLAYLTTTAEVPLRDGVEPLDTADGSPPHTPEVAPLARRIRSRVARSSAGATARAVRQAVTPGASSSTQRSEPAANAATAPSAAAPIEDDSFDGTCNVCGHVQTFVRRNASLREGYRCAQCKASLRYRGQADAILRKYAQHGATSIAEIVKEPAFAQLAFWEPGVLGPFRSYFSTMRSYVVSDFWPDVEPGDERDGVRCEDLMALTFPDASFDLVVTSDIFEHVRKPYVGFAEVHRVLRPGGRHIFSIPVQQPMRAAPLARVDTSGDEDVHLLEPRYHLGPGNSQHIVYNDFGLDLVENLTAVGFDTEVIEFESINAEASRLVTFCSTKR
ncbi:MAG: methyltransferase domain-containing protein [Microthrixaceae bacterium]